jgi:hypothetical protein
MKDLTAEACRRSAAEARNVARRARKVSEREMFQRLADCCDILAQQLEETAERSNDGLLIVETSSTEPTGSSTQPAGGTRNSVRLALSSRTSEWRHTSDNALHHRGSEGGRSLWRKRPSIFCHGQREGCRKTEPRPRSRGPERTGLRFKGAPPGKGFRRSNKGFRRSNW